MDKILVHICCGVDAVYALRRIKEEFPNSEIKGYFYDPNIHPEEEYELRWIETKRVCDDLDIECIKGNYELGTWLERVKGYENEPERGERCTICHDLRLEKTAEAAQELGFNKITTVLMMSPKKDFDVLKNVGEKVAQEKGLEFVAIDFRKKGGIEKMNKLSKEMELYHQNYCGCIYGLFKQREGLEYIPELVSFGKGRLPGSREELLFIKEIRTYAQNLGLQTYEQTFDFMDWRLVSSKLSVKGKHIPHTVLPYSKSIKGILRAKVKKIFQKEDKTIVKLNKSNTEIWILNSDLKEISIDEIRHFTNPVFIVGKENKEIFTEGIKIELQLKTDFNPEAQSQNLIIGSLKSETKIFFHSDTLSDGTGGVNKHHIIEVINEHLEQIKNELVSIIILGAKTFGNIGLRKFHEELKSFEITNF